MRKNAYKNKMTMSDYIRKLIILDNKLNDLKKYNIEVENSTINIEKLKIKEEKIKLIEKYFENQEGYSDKDIKGTRIRVNSTIKIIKENNIEYVLNKIIESKKVPLNTVTKARKILEQQFKK